MSNLPQPAHSKIGASSYSRWSTIHGGCPGSVRLSEGVPSVDSSYAQEGTHAHTVASQTLEKYFFNKEPAEGWLAADKEMRSAVDVYVKFVKCEALSAIADADGRKPVILIEHRFDLSAVYPGLFGTADAIIYNPAAKKLIVADYKHGAGIAVEVEDNLQLQYYGLGALLSTGLPCETVELVIVQPRCEHEDGQIRRWSFSSIDLLDFAADLASDAEAVFKPDAPLNPGKHCRFCPAAATKCPAIKNKAQALAKIEFRNDLSYDPVQLDQALKFIPALESWIKQVREFAYGEAMHGRLPPGWKLVSKRATRKWKAGEDEVVGYMVEATKRPREEFFDQPSLKSPAQMEKLCSKQIGEKLRSMMESVSSGYNLVPESDPRPAAKMDAKSEFTQIGAADGISE
jgi:hypothetical protein